MYKLSPSLKSTMLRNVYYSSIYSHIVMPFKFGVQLAKLTLIKYLFYKKRAIRLISNKAKRPVNPGPLASTNPMFPKLEILKVNYVFILHISSIAYQEKSSGGPCENLA